MNNNNNKINNNIIIVIIIKIILCDVYKIFNKNSSTSAEFNHNAKAQHTNELNCILPYHFKITVLHVSHI
jgi:hypothetical protein